MNLKKTTLLKAHLNFPPGFAEEALTEVKFVLSNLWLKKKYKPFVNLDKNLISIKNIHLDSLIEILYRASLISDLRICILEDRVNNKPMLQKACEKIDFENILGKSIPIKFKVNSIASELFHERAIKEIIEKYLLNKGFIIKRDANLSHNLYFEIFKNKLTVTLSLAGLKSLKKL